MTSFANAIVAAAKKIRPRIVLPEGDDIRVLSAAAKAHADGIADCIVFGNQIIARAKELNIRIPDFAVSPPTKKFIAPLTKLRAHKGMDESRAAKMLNANAAAVAAMMVREKLADGMLAGAAMSSADVLRPVLQIIGAAKNASLASSFFLMEAENETIKVFADCALNARPSAEESADIAVQSANSARLFGLSPIVAMLSYATGDSAAGEEIARVRNATEIAQAQMPDIPVYGPIQYDAAVSPRIAKIKAPQWQNAGRANVLIFPDLASGNIAYKAVQQTSGLAAIGPLMQGLAAPANDLSRGATENDIYLAIAATAVQTAAFRK